MRTVYFFYRNSYGKLTLIGFEDKHNTNFHIIQRTLERQTGRKHTYSHFTTKKDPVPVQVHNKFEFIPDTKAMNRKAKY